MKVKFKKGDKVRVIAGKDKGREGVVEKIFPREGKALVSGINIFKKHLRGNPREGGRGGGIVDVIKPIYLSKISLICPKCKRQTRIGHKISGKEKVRICLKCREEI